MRAAVFSDVHGNLPALEAVLADIRRRRVDAVYCLGDLVGYAPFPNEVVERIRSQRVATIMGNYDDGVGYDREECGCAYREAEERKLGEQSFAWTKAHVTSENKAWLRELPAEIRIVIGRTRVLLVHGSPRKINEYLFEDRPLSSFQHLAASSNADLIVFGHTHRPYMKRIDNVWFVNVGSVGKPKDGNWHAGYAILEPTAAIPASFIRVRYDLRRVTEAIRQSGLPDAFAADLARGGITTATRH